MSVIYRPKGRAAEYSHLALNLYNGCTHGCKYCYVPGRWITAEQFHASAAPRKDIIHKLSKDAPKFAGTNERVLLCFTCDPYQPVAVETGITRQALQILHGLDIPFQVLTKGGMKAVNDFDLYGPNDVFAVSITSLTATLSLKHEPHAALGGNRILSLDHAKHQFNIETWVSLEPVLYPDESLQIIKESHSVVDLFKIGMLNHRSSDINWRRFGIRAIELCEKLEKPYYIKADLARHLNNIPFTNTDTRTVNRKERARCGLL